MTKRMVKIKELELAKERVAAKKWEPDFDGILEEYYGEVSVSDLLSYFSQQGKNFTKQRLYKRAFELGLTGNRSHGTLSTNQPLVENTGKE